MLFEVQERFKKCERFHFLYNPVCSVPVSDNVFDSAVAFIIRESDNGDLYVLLTKRVDSLSNHAGEVCLPGGKYEQSDQIFVNTALRETKEEVGITPEDLQYISTLPPFVAGYSKKLLASFIAIPVVFWLKRNVQLCLNSSEVEAAFWTPLDFFLSTGHLQVDTFTNNRSGQKFEILFFNFTDKASRKKFLIFGCTASICVTVSSIALNRAPEFPCTALGLYWHKQELVVSEVSRSTLNSTSHTSDWNYIPYAVKSKL